MARAFEMGLQIDDVQVRQLLEQMPPAVNQRLRQLIEGAAIDTQRVMIQQAPAGVGGGAGLRGSIHYYLDGSGLTAHVEPTVPYADDVEYGTQPHFVSAAAGSSLAAWANLKGISPFAVQNAIAARGTRPHPFVAPTYNLQHDKVVRDVFAGIKALAEDFDNGRLQG